MKRILTITVFNLLIVYVSVSQNYSDTTFAEQIEKAREMILNLKESQNIPGISIAVAKGGKIIWKEGIGYANIQDNEEVTTLTKFRTGSISKTITALALAKLYDEGKIEWSDPVSKYVSYPNAPEYTFTIRQLAGHLSGIRHYKGFEFFSNKPYESVEESLEVFKRDKLLFEPGTKYKYTTYGYSLLGRLIEVVSEQSYADYVANEILAPLRMSNTILEDAGFDESGTSIFYNKGGKREAREVNVSVKWAGGGFLSTPSDLVNMINYAGNLVSLSTLMELITSQKLQDGSTTGYGMGFRISEVQSTKQKIVHHGGKITGARPYLLVLSDQQLAIAICTNSEADYGVVETYQIAKLFVDSN